eukprot:s1351_g3.t1
MDANVVHHYVFTLEHLQIDVSIYLGPAETFLRVLPLFLQDNNVNLEADVINLHAKSQLIMAAIPHEESDLILRSAGFLRMGPCSGWRVTQSDSCVIDRHPDASNNFCERLVGFTPLGR